MREVTIYRTPLLTLDPNATAGGGLVEVVKLADHDAALRRAKAEGVREASGAAKKLANGVVPTAAMNALNLLGVELDARAAQIEEGE